MHALQEMRSAFEKTAVSVRTQRLHDADVNVGVKVVQKSFAVDGDVVGERAKIIIEKVVREFGREVGLGVVEQRSGVVLQGACTAALAVDEIRLAVDLKDGVALQCTREVGCA